jgi:DNA primase
MPSPRELLGKIDIVDVISSYIELKRVGNSYVARCPFHPDDTPSFYVSPSKGIFKCFGCGVGGDAVKFVSLYENVDYWEALERLAKRYGIRVSVRKREKDSQLLLALQRVTDFYHEELKKSRTALEYLQSRGIGSKTISRFSLGFGGNTEALVKRLMEEGLLGVYEKSSNLTRLDSGVYRDLFRNRLVIPIRDIKGNVVAFGGRSLDGSHPKYVNSPESEVFRKRATLFGLFESKDYIRESGQVVVVEGYFDLMSLWQEGIRNCVAPLGTALTEEHAGILSRMAKTAILLYDGDSAGRRAVRSSVPYLIGAGMEVKVVYLPEGEDPDSFVKKDPEGLRKMISSAPTVEEELLRDIEKGNRSALEDLLYFCGFIPDGLRKFELLREISSATGLPITNLQERLPKVERKAKGERVDLSYHEAVLLAGLYRFGLEGLDLNSLRLSPQAMELIEALQREEYHLLPDYIKNLRIFNLERAFQESMRALGLPEERPALDFDQLRKESREQPRKLRLRK